MRISGLSRMLCQLQNACSVSLSRHFAHFFVTLYCIDRSCDIRASACPFSDDMLPGGKRILLCRLHQSTGKSGNSCGSPLLVVMTSSVSNSVISISGVIYFFMIFLLPSGNKEGFCCCVILIDCLHNIEQVCVRAVFQNKKHIR